MFYLRLYILTCFSNLQKDWKLRDLNVTESWTFQFFLIHKRVEKLDEILGFLNICLDCIFQFYQIPKEFENWNYRILVRKLQMIKNAWKLEVFTWILSQSSIANLNVSFTSVVLNFYHFRRVNFKISEN